MTLVIPQLTAGVRGSAFGIWYSGFGIRYSGAILEQANTEPPDTESPRLRAIGRIWVRRGKKRGRERGYC